MPLHDGFGSYKDERLLPARPESVRSNPEQFVEQSEPWSGMATFEYCELLPEREIFEKKLSTSTKGTSDGFENEPQNFEHGSIVQ